jgi:hypothetical protein
LVFAPTIFAKAHLVHSAAPAISCTILSPPEVRRHISTSLPAGTGLAQLICGLLLKRVVENRQVTMQEALPFNGLVITMLATSSPGRIVHLKGTDSAAAGAESNPPTNANQQIDDLALMKPARVISLPPFSTRR